MAGEEDQSILKVLVELVDQVTEPLHKVQESFEEFESSVWELTQAFASVYLGYELLEGLLEPAREFQNAQVGLALATNASTEALAAFKEQGEELSETMPQALSDITDAQTNMFQTFSDYGIAKIGAEQATALATILGIKPLQASNDLASAVENLGDQSSPVGERMESLVDKIAVLATKFPMAAQGAARLGSDLGRIGPVAREFGVTTNAIFATMGELARLHVGGRAGPGSFMSNLLSQALKVDAKTGISHLQALGVTIARTGEAHDGMAAGSVNWLKTLQLMSQMDPTKLKHIEESLGTQGLGLTALLSNMKGVLSSYDLFANSAGAGAAAAAARTKTFDAQLTILKNTTENFAELLGTTMLPAITRWIELLAEGAKSVIDFAEAHPTLTKIVATTLAIGAAVLTLVALIGLAGAVTEFLLGGWKQMGELFLAVINPAGEVFTGIVLELTDAGLGLAASMAIAGAAMAAIAIAIAAILFGIYEIYNHWEKVHEVLLEVIDDLHSIWTFGTKEGGIADKLWNFGLPNGSDVRAERIDMRNDGFDQSRLYGQNGPAGATAAQLTYSPTVHVHGNADEDVLNELHRNHSEDMATKLNEQMRQFARQSFLDPTLAH